MNWATRALLGPGLWALAFALIYAVHGLGCARGWVLQPAPLGNLHVFTLNTLWLAALAGAIVILWRTPRGDGTGAQIARAGGWIGLASIALTLFPVMGLSSCEILPP
ncbi:hypothetical protein [Falsigemmobacter faecalis]|uniref:Uncharacterized protein n=1 Tax=Falsigemmobacter faecalis TaxID=2488730 RepID=A0A3P3DER2_9RHOB|nr:hypothetical protein [Falsigemmobacter faecalis]RRH72767.1 hypothetical protein EG244_13915 [Falsigemmobacter faecalis]